MARTLHLQLKREYFEAIRDGSKPEEFRLRTEHWRKRLEGREYDCIVLTLGYPAKTDAARRIERPWRGFKIKTCADHDARNAIPCQQASHAGSGPDAKTNG